MHVSWPSWYARSIYIAQEGWKYAGILPQFKPMLKARARSLTALVVARGYPYAKYADATRMSSDFKLFRVMAGLKHVLFVVL